MNTKKSINWRHILGVGWPAITTLALIFVLYYDTLCFYWSEWNRGNGYYSHGIIVPFITLFLIWMNKEKLSHTPIKPSWWGLLLILPSIPVFLFGKWTGSGALVSITFLVNLVGASLLIYGTKVTRILLFPLLYLVFMIPLPGIVLDESTMRIQMLSTKYATMILNLSGYEAVQNGSQINSGYLPEPLVVGVACSGFKLLISLMTFTALFVYIVKANWWKKTLIAVMSFPLSIFINSLRIAMIGYAGIWTDSAENMHTFHDYSGYLGLIICFVLLFGFAKLIKVDKIEFGQIEDVKEDSSVVSVDKAKINFWPRTALLGILLFALVMIVIIKPLETSDIKGHLDRERIPTKIGDWVSRDLPIADTVSAELKTGDLLQRVYTDFSGYKSINLFVTAAHDSDAFHNPMMCIPGSGSGIANQKIIEFTINKPRKVKIVATVLEISGDYSNSMVLYWYMCGDKIYPNTSSMKKAMREMQINDILSSIIHLSERDEINKRAKDRQWYWYRFSTGINNDYDSDLEHLKSFITKFISYNKDFGER